MNIIVSIIIVVHDEHNYNNDTQSKYIFKYNLYINNEYRHKFGKR